MTALRHALWGILGSLVLAVGFQGCATTAWINMTNTQTDVAVDRAACDAQLAQETQGGAASLYVAEPFWVYEVRQCMQRQGWSPPHWQLSSL